MNRARQHSLRARSGFTQAELVIGLAVTVMTLGAVGVFMMSTAQAWRAADQVQSAQLSSVQASNRIQEIARSAKFLGWAGAKSDGSGSAALLWLNDANGDGRMQIGEMGLLDHNSAAGTLTLYTVPGASGSVNNTASIDDINDASDVTAFKSIPQIKSQVMVRNVPDVTFTARDPGDPKQRPTLEYKISSLRDNRTFGETESAALRAPKAKPVTCDGASNCNYTGSGTGGGCAAGSPSGCGCAGDQPCRGAGTTYCHIVMPTNFSTATAAAQAGN